MGTPGKKKQNLTLGGAGSKRFPTGPVKSQTKSKVLPRPSGTKHTVVQHASGKEVFDPKGKSIGYVPNSTTRVGPKQPHPNKLYEQNVMEPYAAAGAMSKLARAASTSKAQVARRATAAERPQPGPVARNAMAQKGGAQARLSGAMHKGGKAKTNIPKPEQIVEKTKNKMSADVRQQTNSPRARAQNDRGLARMDKGFYKRNPDFPTSGEMIESAKSVKRFADAERKGREAAAKAKAARSESKTIDLGTKKSPQLSARERIAREDAARRAKRR